MSNTNTKYIIQFLPISLEPLSRNKHFYLGDVKLKSSYVIDLIHNLLFKYFYTKENQFTLSSIVLKEKYGYQYNLYILYLTENGYLKLIKKHKNGVNCRIYELNNDLIKKDIIRFKNKDSVLLKKRKSYILQNSISESPIDAQIKSKLIQDLYSVKIDSENSTLFLKSFEIDKQVITKNLLTVESISDGDIFYHFDSYGRFHTNFTILKSFLRKNFLSIDGESTVEIDIKNSQPLFFNKILQKSHLNYDIDELKFYGELTLNGNFYNHLQTNLEIKDKSKVKNLVYKIFFGRNYQNDLEKKFKSLFPSIYDFIKQHKKLSKDYKSISYELQRLESNFIYNKVIKYIYENHPTIKIITCHDSLICKKSDHKIVNDIFQKFLEEEFEFLKTKSFSF